MQSLVKVAARCVANVVVRRPVHSIRLGSSGCVVTCYYYYSLRPELVVTEVDVVSRCILVIWDRGSSR